MWCLKSISGETFFIINIRLINCWWKFFEDFRGNNFEKIKENSTKFKKKI